MSKELTPLEAFQLFCKELKVENSKFANAIETALKDGEWYKQEMIKFEKAFTEENEEKLKLQKVLEIIKKLNPYTIVEVQGQWYLMIGDIFVKAPKIPITEEEAILLKKVLL